MKLIIPIILLLSHINGQSFGQNKLQYRDFDWNFIQTPHFDIYYYGGQQDLAEFAAEVAEEAYEQISIHLRWDLKKESPLWSIIRIMNFSRPISLAHICVKESVV